MKLKTSRTSEIRRLWLRNVRDGAQTFRRQLRRLLTQPRSLLEYARYRKALRRHDWSALRAMLRPFSQSALRVGDRRLLSELGHAALRLEEHQLGAELLYAARAGDRTLSHWRGEDIPNDTLAIHLMEKASQGVAAGLDVTGHVRAAAQRAARTILIVEPRMVALLQRTLPEVVVLPFGADLSSHAHGKIFTAGIEELRFLLGYDAATLSRLYTPLVSDVAKTREMRERYRMGHAPLIGISWWSSHYGKDLPSPDHWRRLVSDVPAQFVSLQYGDVVADVEFLRDGDPRRVLVDPQVDQLSDMDTFASQIAALDLVISISNSGAHLAGALGKRMMLVRDDLFRRNWPYLSRAVPWFPQTTVIGKDDRPWDVVFDEIIALARKVTSSA